MNLTPPADRVLIRQCEPETETAFGLMLPQTALKESLRGIVVAVGKGIEQTLPSGERCQWPLALHRGTETTPSEGVSWEWWGSTPEYPLRALRPGDEVVLPRFGGTEIDWNDETLVSILASEILGVLV